MDKSFISKYAPLVTDNVCIANDTDPRDLESRAVLAYKLLTGEVYVNIIDTKKAVYYKITSDGYIIDAETLKPIANYANLVEEPLGVACKILTECTADSKDPQAYQLQPTTRNLMWLASLFVNMHDAFSFNSENPAPILWRLCDYSYKDVNHIADSKGIARKKVLFSFATGFITGDERHNYSNADAFLNTKLYIEAAPDTTFECYQLLEAYIAEHNLNVLFR